MKLGMMATSRLQVANPLILRVPDKARWSGTGQPSGIPDAPFDGIIYGRQNGVWVPVSGAPPAAAGQWVWDGASQSWVLANQGVTDGSDAAPGEIGEVVAAAPATWPPVQTSLYPAFNWVSVISADFSPGDWDVSGEAYWSIASPMQQIIVAQAYLGTSTSEADFLGYGAYQVLQPNFATASGTFGTHRFNIVAPATLYVLLSLVAFNAADATIYAAGAGYIYGRRMR